MTRRVFFAINLPDSLKHELAGLVEELARRHNHRKISWVLESNFHITLHFLGNKTDKEIEALDEQAKKVAHATASFTLRTGAFGCFPDRQQPRVIVLETHNTNEAPGLVKKLGNALVNQGFEIDSRPWRSHITIGRVKDSGGACDLGGITFPSHEIPVTNFELMESTLSPEGSTYHVIQSYPL